jgi:hypothetical protein
LEALEDRCLLSAGITLTPSEPAPQLVGQPITWTATVPDASAGLVYQFSVKSPHTPFHVVRDFSPDDHFTWAPMQEGKYRIKVTVKDGFDAQDTESAVVTDKVGSRVAGEEPVISPTSNPLVALFSAPPGPEGTVHVEFAVAGDNPSWCSTNELPSVPGKSTNFLVAGMLPATTYEMRDVFSDGTTSAPLRFTTGAIPSTLKLPSFTVRQAPAAGSDLNQDMIFHVLAGPVGQEPNPAVLATDLMGRVVWYYDSRGADPGLALRLGDTLLPGGTLLVYGRDQHSSQAENVLREIDLAGDPVRETNLDAVNAQLTALGHHVIYGFSHDNLRLANGDTVVLGFTERTVNLHGTPTDYIGDMVVVLDPNFQVKWAWDAFDHLDVNRGPVLGEVVHPGDTSPEAVVPRLPAVDWSLVNAVSLSPSDGNLVLSVRYQDWVIKIDYENGAGDGHVIWRLGKDGDFTVSSTGPSPWFSHQHNAHYINDSTIILFDNGNTRRASDPTADSLGQVWKLDEQTMTATLVFNGDLGNYSSALGAAQRLSNGDFSFTSGLQGQPPKQFGQTIEVRPDGSKAYVLEVNTREFRSFRIRTLYEGTSDQLEVTNNADSGPGSLRAAIAAAQDGDVIRFDRSLDGQTITLTSGELFINKSLEIEGLGTDELTVSGNGTSRVFDITASGADVTIAGLTIADGLATQGGGIENLAGILTLSHVKLANDQAVGPPGGPGEGGGVYNGSAATLHVIDSDFTGDVVKGGAAAAKGDAGIAVGGGLFNAGAATLDDSTFTANRAAGGDSAPGGQGGNGMGGAVGNAGALAVHNSTFTDNQAVGGVHGRAGVYPFVGAGGGAAIMNLASLTVDDSTFADNQSFGGAGYAGVAGGNGNAPAIQSDGAPLAPGQTGAQASVTVSHSTFLDNHATGGPGGAGAAGGGGNGGAILTTDTTFTITDSIFRGNQATGGTGGTGGAGGVGRGGAIYQSARDGDATLVLSHSVLVDNRAVGGEAGTGGKGGSALGGAIENLDNTPTPGLHIARLTVRHCTLAGNEAQGGDGSSGGDGTGGGIANQDGAVLTVIHTLLFGNLARGGDGGPGGDGGAGLGGGLYVSDGTVQVWHTHITANLAVGGSGGEGGHDGRGVGGGVYIVPGGTAYARHTRIRGNHASTSDDDVFGDLGQS